MAKRRAKEIKSERVLPEISSANELAASLERATSVLWMRQLGKNTYESAMITADDYEDDTRLILDIRINLASVESETFYRHNYDAESHQWLGEGMRYPRRQIFRADDSRIQAISTFADYMESLRKFRRQLMKPGTPITRATFVKREGQWVKI